MTLYGCGGSTDPEDTGFPDIDEDECDLIGVNYEDQVFPFVEGACFKILRTWTIIDWCQYPDYGPWEHLQVIKVIDEFAPEFTSGQPPVEVCNDFDCGPAYVELIQTGTDDCTPDNELRWTYGVDEFNDGSIDIPGQGIGSTINASGDYVIGDHRIVYTFEDACGNKTTEEQFFSVLACKAPTPICLNGLSADLMPVDLDNDGEADWGMVTLWASDFDKGSLHTCGYPVTVSFSPDTNDINRVFDCNDLGGQVPVELWVTDRVLGNQAYCETYIIIQDNMNVCPDDPGATGVISGTIDTEDSERVKAVNVDLNGSALDPIVTAEDGEFAFPAMPMGGTYTIQPAKNDDWKNGVSTLDLIKIQKHLLGMEHLGSPYKMIAADANNSGSLSAVDLVWLRKLILGTITEVPGNTSWRFVDASYDFVDPANPLEEDFPESYTIGDFNASMEVDFKAIKTGDVNNTVQANIGGDDTKAPTGITFKLKDRQVYAGQDVRVAFTADETAAILGYQFTLNFDESALSFTRLEDGSLGMDEENIGLARVDFGAISASWGQVTPANITEGEELFTFVFRATANGMLSEMISIGSRLTNAESYDVAGNVNSVGLSFGAVEKQSGEEFALFQNNPNPFSSHTQVAFTLPEATQTEVTVYDVTGKVIYYTVIDANAGLNQLTLQSSDLQGSGVLYYNVKTDQFSATRKMLMVR